jgi:hypothetical protein
VRRLGILLVAALAACASPEHEEVDYSREAAYYRYAPRSVIVLPARNITTAVEAPRLFQSTISRPLIERGYYVLPPELVAEILHREGIYEEEAWDVPPHRLREYLGADAALYVEIKDWDTKYAVVASSVAVTLHYRMVDTFSGDTIWEDEKAIVRQSGSTIRSGGDALSWLIVSTIDATITALTTDYVPLAQEANRIALSTLPPGHYRAGYADLRKAVAAWEEAERAKEKGEEPDRLEAEPRREPAPESEPDEEAPPPPPVEP